MPVVAATAGLLCLAVTVLAVHAAVLRPLAWIAWIVLLLALTGWLVALRLRRRRARRGVNRVGQWVRSARIDGGQIDGLAAVRAGAPIGRHDSADGWLVVERELLRFRPDPTTGPPEAAWSVPWDSLAVVDVAPAASVPARLLPGLRRSVVTLRLRGRGALVVEVADDAMGLLRSWQWYGVGERTGRRRGAAR